MIFFSVLKTFESRSYESKAKLQKLFKSKFDHRKFLRKWF